MNAWRRHPTIGTVGLTEPQARKKYGDDAVKICTYHLFFVADHGLMFFRPNPILYSVPGLDKSSFRALYFAMIDEAHKEPSVYKLICVGEDERVVGVHIIGLGSDEVMQGFAVAVVMGARKEDLDNTVAIHPTSAEGASRVSFLIIVRLGRRNPPLLRWRTPLY